MPHPERHIDPTQHPRWTRGEAGPVGDGLQDVRQRGGVFRIAADRQCHGIVMLSEASPRELRHDAICFAQNAVHPAP